ncbi:MAG: polysaccharide pyruvyl transferase family protein [Clostridia bacterium]|nr:polysaccharide pyruvyl transferase family protein [Clostridia bacterium]
MGLYKKIEEALGEKSASSVLKIFLSIKSFPFSVQRCLKIFSNSIKKLFIKEKRIFLISTPNHGNMGDQLIAVAEIKWLKDYFPDYEIKDFVQSILMQDKKLKLLSSQIKKDDLIFLHGGGNVNNWYLISEDIRRNVIKNCPENKLVLFQQSINLTTPVNGVSIKEETEKIYNNHKNFTIIAREETSYQNALKSFPRLNVLKYPDMATYLFNKLKPSHSEHRNGVISCVRKDVEKFYSDEQIQMMYDKIKNDFDLTVSDTHVGHHVSAQNRMSEVQKLIDSIAKHKVMVTDRFHGAVFSILANTPCVVLRSADHKITDGVKWFKDVEGIFFADDISQVPDLVKKAEKYSPLTQPDFSHYFEKLYNDITKKP